MSGGDITSPNTSNLRGSGAAILASTGALVLRSGSWLPGFLPRGVSPRAALALAQGMIPFGKDPKLALTSGTHRLVKFTNERPKLTKCLRRRVIQQLRKLSGQLVTARLRLSRKLPPKAPARSLNIQLIILIMGELGYPDKQLSRDLVYGAGIVGGMETTNSLATRTIPAATKLGRVENILAPRHRSILKALANAKNLNLKRKRRVLSIEEFRNGWLSEPVPVAEFYRHNAALSLRVSALRRNAVHRNRSSA